MSYMSDLRQPARAALPLVSGRANASAIPFNRLAWANTRLSETLEATILVATLSGVSLVMSTIAAGAF